MKHKHYYIPPFWKYNQFCLFCGKIKKLSVGSNTVTLTDNVIQFGSSTSLTAAKQLGFDASNNLILHNGSGTQIVSLLNNVPVKKVQTSSVASITVASPYYIDTAATITINEAGDYILIIGGRALSFGGLSRLGSLRLLNSTDTVEEIVAASGINLLGIFVIGAKMITYTQINKTLVVQVAGNNTNTVTWGDISLIAFKI